MKRATLLSLPPEQAAKTLSFGLTKPKERHVRRTRFSKKRTKCSLQKKCGPYGNSTAAFFPHLSHLPAPIKKQFKERFISENSPKRGKQKGKPWGLALVFSAAGAFLAVGETAACLAFKKESL
jgi:hypothetical protein